MPPKPYFFGLDLAISQREVLKCRLEQKLMHSNGCRLYGLGLQTEMAMAS